MQYYEEGVICIGFKELDFKWIIYLSRSGFRVGSSCVLSCSGDFVSGIWCFMVPELLVSGFFISGYAVSGAFVSGSFDSEAFTSEVLSVARFVSRMFSVARLSFFFMS